MSCRGGSPDTFAVEDNLRLGSDGVQVAEAKFGSIKTNRIVERRQALVVGIYEYDIRAREERSTVAREFDDLNGGLIANFDAQAAGDFDVGDAEGPGVRAVRGTQKLPRLDERGGEVHGSAIRAVGVDPDVDVEKSSGVSGEPAGLEGNRTAIHRPVRPVP